PFSGLDAGSRSLMRNELREAADRGRLVIFVSHNPEEDGEIADMTLVIENRGIRRSSDWRGAGEERRG
ncbi:MAG: hypothetical protein K2H64_02080, partial [Desulfovibrio sp.]|nr:hypothetical protein [Desulfovibrio sp.]